MRVEHQVSDPIITLVCSQKEGGQSIRYIPFMILIRVMLYFVWSLIGALLICTFNRDSYGTSLVSPGKSTDSVELFVVPSLATRFLLELVCAQNRGNEGRCMLAAKIKPTVHY